MTSGIFISYRRSDSKSEARSICQRLERTFGKGKVFIDVDSIRPGEDFQSVLKEDLAKCNVMLVVIGPRWLELLRSGPAGSEIIEDYVRLEIASALERKLPIFPVLVDGAPMPDAKNMPDDLKSLAFRQAFSVRHDSFPRDMSGLEQELRRFVPARAIWKVAVIAGLFAISLGAISYFVWWSLLPSAKSYARFGNFACFAEGQYPESWREDASFVRRTAAVSESCPGTRASRSEPGRDRKPSFTATRARAGPMNAGCNIPVAICGHTANSRCSGCDSLESNTLRGRGVGLRVGYLCTRPLRELSR